MSESENKQLLRRYYEEVLMEGRLDVLDTIARGDYVEHNPFQDTARVWRVCARGLIPCLQLSSSSSRWSF